MPIHEYQCLSCGARFESLVHHGETADPQCPRCGAADLKRQLSSFAVGRADHAATGPCGSSDCACRHDIG